MNRSLRHLLACVLLVGLAACSQGPNVIGKGPLQARKYRPGWHLDLRTGTHPMTRRSAPRPLEARLPAPAEPLAGRPLTVQVVTAQPVPTPPSKAPRTPIIAPEPPLTLDPALNPIAAQDEPENLMPKKRWSCMGMVAFLLATGTAILGFSAFGTTTVLLAAGFTALIAGFTLRRIRKREQAGKGFALIALLVAFIALVITGVSIALLGFT